MKERTEKKLVYIVWGTIVLSLLMVFFIHVIMPSIKALKDDREIAESILNHNLWLYPGVEWIEEDKNAIYIGWKNLPEDYQDICMDFAELSKRSGKRHCKVYAFDATQVTKEDAALAKDKGLYIYSTE